MAPTFFRILLLAIVAYAFFRGGRDARIVAALCLTGAIASLLVVTPLHGRYQNVETAVFAVDFVMLAGFIWVALKSDRFWPLWMAGVQLTTVMGHLMKQINSDLMPRAYAASLGFWAYWTLVILAAGVWRHHRRELARQGSLPNGA